MSKSTEGNETVHSSESFLSDSDDGTAKQTPQKLKRVHFALNASEIASIVNSDNESLADIIENDIDIAKKFRKELDKCLLRLKSESAEILGIPFTPGESNIDHLSKQVMWLSKVNEELNNKLSETENTIIGHQEENNRLKTKIQKMQDSLIIAENKKEIISEGYGAQDRVCEDEMQDISQIQDRGFIL